MKQEFSGEWLFARVGETPAFPEEHYFSKEELNLI